MPLVKPAIRVFGFGAAGRAGKASSLDRAGVPVRGLVPLGREPKDGDIPEEGVEETPPQAGAFADILVVAGSGGNMLLALIAPAIDTPRPTAAARDDCAVEDFRRNTRFPPAAEPRPVLEFMPGSAPLGPGSAG